jgi:hypothetical protein
MRIRYRGNVLPSRCLETKVVSEPFASNGCFSGSTVLALNKYATIQSELLIITFVFYSERRENKTPLPFSESVSENKSCCTQANAVFVPKREQLTGGWREIHNEELHNFYSSPNIIRTIKSKRMK